MSRARSWDLVARDALTAGLTWRVHSVFRRALNLVSGRGDLLGIVAAPACDGPATLVLAPPVGLPDLTGLLAAGLPVHPRGRAILVGDRLTVDLSGVALWNPPPVERTVPDEALRWRAARAARLAAAEAPAGGLAGLLGEVDELVRRAPPGQEPSPLAPRPSPLAAVARARIVDLARAIRAERPEGVQDAARSLSGLGPGLTPSGDDVLAGLALGLRAAGSLPDRLSGAIVEAVGSGRTTDLAAARARHAAAGRADAATHDLLVELVAGAGAGLDGAVRSVLDFGHSSGADTLLGVLVGVALACRA